MKTILTICIVVFLMTTSVLAQDELTQAEFKKLHGQLEPKAEAWKTIPWHADLLSAQRKAIEEKKLIFIWSMDGHPLGCV